MIYPRAITTQLTANIGVKPIIILYGARQVGKTTLARTIMEQYPKSLYLQGDDPRDRARLEDRSMDELQSLISGYDLVVIDEAQQVRNIGHTLKLIADHASHIPVLATGSSSFELANKLNEPLTGRNRKFTLYPLSLAELVKATSRKAVEDGLLTYMNYGTYPEVVSLVGERDKQRALVDLATDYLLKDIFQFGDIRNPFVFEKLIQILALRIGSEISYASLATEIGVSRDTVYAYVTMLEQAFIIYRLTPFYTNKQKEIIKNHKIYFCDMGMRNAVLRSFDPVDMRSDKGAIFENFYISEMMKARAYAGKYSSMHYWRNRQGGEIDLIESTNADTEIHAYECKWKTPAQKPLSFATTYPHADFQSITTETIVQFFCK